MVATFNKHRLPVTLSFQDKIEIEQIRALEESGIVLLARFDGESCSDFIHWLKARTTTLKQQASLRVGLKHAPHLYNRLLFSAGFLLAVLGIISTSSLLTQADNTLNIFWLLGALLGINGLSLLLWLIFALSAGRRNGGIIAPILHRVMLWLTPSDANNSVKFKDPKGSYKSIASRAWFTAQFNPNFHHWYLGRLTHWAWCCYLCGSIIGLLLLFATRQFDFVWESTLLNADTFVQLSQWLATPLQWLGLSIPSETDIIRSGTGALTSYSSDLRQQWALFLLGCLVVYGLFPRMIAALICSALERRGRRRWTLDFSLPYYRQLQQQYWPQSSQSTIIDADHAAVPPDKAGGAIEERPVPTDAYWLGLELHPQLPWSGFDSPAYLGQVNDRDSLKALGAQVAELTSPVAIVVEASRVPDRGLQRDLREILAHCRQPWLVLLDNDGASNSKWQDWTEVARKLGFADTQTTRMKVTKSTLK